MSGSRAEDSRWGDAESPRVLDVRRIGRSSFQDAHALQLELVEARARDAIRDVLVLTEHDGVYTVGRGASGIPQAVPEGLDPAIPVVPVERGGEVTYHGPGQLVAYPILRLPEQRRDLHRYMRDLEEVVVRVLAEVEVRGERRPGLTGVWIGEHKVCSLGVAVRRWVTYHGIALNVRTELEPFRRIRPCGLDPAVMTRLCDHAELPPTNLLMEVLFVKHFTDVFDFELPPASGGPPHGNGGGGEGGAGSGGAGVEGGFPTLPILG